MIKINTVRNEINNFWTWLKFGGKSLRFRLETQLQWEAPAALAGMKLLIPDEIILVRKIIVFGKNFNVDIR